MIRLKLLRLKSHGLLLSCLRPHGLRLSKLRPNILRSDRVKLSRSETVVGGSK